MSKRKLKKSKIFVWRIRVCLKKPILGPRQNVTRKFEKDSISERIHSENDSINVCTSDVGTIVLVQWRSSERINRYWLQSSTVVSTRFCYWVICYFCYWVTSHFRSKWFVCFLRGKVMLPTQHVNRWHFEKLAERKHQVWITLFFSSIFRCKDERRERVFFKQLFFFISWKGRNATNNKNDSQTGEKLREFNWEVFIHHRIFLWCSILKLSFI